MQMDSTIKRIYDQYHLSDFEYGKVGSDNLNPQREMIKDQVAIIEAAVQELTDEIVRKRIKKPEELEEPVNVSMQGESPTSASQERKNKTKRAGSDSLAIFGDIPKELELIIGAFPGSANELSLPPIIECEEILKKYNFNTGNVVETTSPDDGEMTFEISTSDDDDDDDEDEDYYDDEDEDSELDIPMSDCAEVELLWIKIIMAILKIIKILMSILKKVISTIMLVIQIVVLAAGAWLNPPNVGYIVQIIVSKIIGIVCMIVAKLIQLLFSLLNLDCTMDQIMELLEQIQNLMNEFSSTIGMIDPHSVALLGDMAMGGWQQALKDLVSEILEQKREAWEQAAEEVKKTFSNDNLNKIKDQLIKEATKTAIETANAETDGKATAIINEASAIVSQAKQIKKETEKKMNETMDAYASLTKSASKAGSKSTDAGLNRILSDPSIKGLSME